MKTTLNLKSWWNQFPPKLRLLTRGRFFASIGAGGVLYLTPLVFNDLAFSATEIGSGLTVAALAGTITRLITGIYLDKGAGFAGPVKIAAFTAMIGDCALLTTSNYWGYVGGEFFLGSAAGIYWPSVELGVPISCENFKSNKGFALVRSADALGISIGALSGAFLASLDAIRLIYVIEIICMMTLISLLSNKRLIQNKNNENKSLKDGSLIENFSHKLRNFIRLIPNLLPILILSLLATGILSLLQSALPLDLVIGGVERPAMNKSFIGFLIAIQLTLLLIIQWPIGNWLTKKTIKFGLGLSLTSFSIGCFLLSISSLFLNGLSIAFIGLISISIGLAAFLPTATEAVIQISPKNYRGISMAVYSQCFGVSALVAPWLAGVLIDANKNAVMLWLIAGFLCILATPLTRRINTNQIFD